MEARVITIQTPKKIMLDGFIFGPKKAKIIYIFLHGLGGGLFSRIDLMEQLITPKTAVMAFNNRGHGLINRFKKVETRKSVDYVSVMGGSILESFIDTVDDIKGAIKCAKENGYKKIVLVGHSTGSNKVAYYLSKNFNDDVMGGVLLAPMSDYASIIQTVAPGVYKKAIKFANKYVDEKKGDKLLPESIWPQLISSQRFLSLFTPDSKEEIFSYVSNKKSNVLRKIKKPLLIILAQKDGYADRDIDEIYKWFKKESPINYSKLLIIKNAIHSFKDCEVELRKEIVKWLNSIKK